MTTVTASKAQHHLAVVMFSGGRIRVEIGDALQCMAGVLGGDNFDILGRAQSDDFLLASTVFGTHVGPGDCHLLTGPDRSLPSDEVLFNVARQSGAKEMLFGSRARAPITEVSEEDAWLFEQLLYAVVRNDLKVVEHVIVAPGGYFRFMSESPQFSDIDESG